MFGSLFCCFKKKIVREKKQFCILISDCVKKIEALPKKEYQADTDTIRELPKEILDTIKEIYKKAKRRIDFDASISVLINELLFSPLADALNDLEKLMNNEEYEKFANTVFVPFDKSDHVCSLM